MCKDLREQGHSETSKKVDLYTSDRASKNFISYFTVMENKKMILKI